MKPNAPIVIRILRNVCILFDNSKMITFELDLSNSKDIIKIQNHW